MKISQSFRTSALGFTLIELLVTVAIMALLVGGGIAGFINFNDRQTVLTQVDVIKEALQVAQSKANAGELGGCSKLTGWRVANNTSFISVQSVCQGGTSGSTSVFELTGVTASFSPSSTVTFNALNGSIDFSTGTSVTVTIIQAGVNKYAFAIDRGGQVSAGDWI